jgi:Tol biopolymer transport system component
MRVLSQLLCLLLVLPALAGCAKAPAASAGAEVEPSAEPRVVYTSSGSIGLASVRPNDRGRHVLIAERAQSGGKVQLRWLDLVSGNADTPISAPAGPGWVGGLDVSATGAVAVVDVRDGAGVEQSAVWALAPNGSWHQATDYDGKMRLIPRWSPDSRYLTYYRYRYGGDRLESAERIVATVPLEGGRAVETVILPNASPSDSAVWSADSRSLYCIRARGDEPWRLERIEWPGLASRTVLEADGIFFLKVAEDAGDIIVGTASLTDVQQHEQAPMTVWRIQPGSAVMRTNLRLQRTPSAAKVSPDGRLLAMIPYNERGLVIGDLQSGTKRSLLATDDLSPSILDWALQGKGLLVEPTEEDSHLWVVPVPTQ